jgi:hypothetical protein
MITNKRIGTKQRIADNSYWNSTKPVPDGARKTFMDA